MDDDVAAADRLGVRAQVVGSGGVVVNDRAGGAIPDLDSERVGRTTRARALDLNIAGGQQEAVARDAIDRAGAFVLR